MSKYRLPMLFFLTTLLSISCNSGNGLEDYSHASHGPIADKVIYTVVDDTAAIQNIIDGTHDILLSPVPSGLLSRLEPSELDSLDIYTASSDIRSLLLNPIPNKPPYTVHLADNTVMFNPFAIREVRYAVNWLINRRQLIDTFFSGEGNVMFTAITPNQPGTYRYSLIPAKLGLTEEGDEERALSDIRYALLRAAELPENKGNLKYEAGKWQYNGKPVSVKLILRSDESENVIAVCRYIASQLEKTGITIAYEVWTAGQVFDAVYKKNPADYTWNIYPECWSAPEVSRWWDHIIALMYAPFELNMPGGGNPLYWNYTNATLDRYAKKAVYGQYLYAADYWNACFEVTKQGVLEAVRIYLLAHTSHFIAHKERFNQRLLYGIGEGFNSWTIRAADIKADTDGMFQGQKVLRALYCTTDIAMTRQPWDPVGIHGFNDIFSSLVANTCSDDGVAKAPHTAKDIPLFSCYDISSLTTAPKLDFEGKITGTLPVDQHAELYDSKHKKWVRPDFGITAAGRAVGWIKDGYYWHNGQKITITDLRYNTSFDTEWAVQDGSDDRYFDSVFAETVLPILSKYKGSCFTNAGFVTNYMNYYFAPDKNKTAAVIGSQIVHSGLADREVVIPWELLEAISELLAHGGQHQTRYSMSDSAQAIDLLHESCVNDIRHQLEQFLCTEHIPDALKGFITVEEAVSRYKASIAFIEKYRHAFISNGPFLISAVDPNTNMIIAEAFRTYPYEPFYWYTQFSQRMTKISAIEPPQSFSQKDDAVYQVSVEEYTFPGSECRMLNNGAVKMVIHHEDGTEAEYQGLQIKRGLYTITIPRRDLAKLIKGLRYTAVISSSIADEIPSFKIVHFTI